MGNNIYEAMINKHTLKTNELGKISFKVPPKSEDPKILKIDDNGNVISLSDREKSVVIYSNSTFNTEDEFESCSYKRIYIPVTVVSKNDNNINKLRGYMGCNI